MKYLILGLGSFGSSLGTKLTAIGHEVIGVDASMTKVETLKHALTHAICADCTDPLAVAGLPVRESDVVVVAIGEDEGANIMTTALMKQMHARRLISRAVSPLHQTVLEAMGVDKIVHPEEETAERWAKKLDIKGVVDSFELSLSHTIIEVESPAKFIGKTIREIGFRRTYGVLVLTIIRPVMEKNMLGVARKVNKVLGVISSGTTIEPGDVLVIYGEVRDIRKMMAA
ncbi:MAG: TrkA family potassium uptake protein [Saprospiraceae bacterium]|nr:TrkA family potassium uptake protein [Saprospiraceae bacterium]